MPNPMQLNGPNKTGNHVQADYRVPSAAANVGTAPPPNADEQNLNYTSVPAKYVQPGIAPCGPF
jgi:hypothetical protein